MIVSNQADLVKESQRLIIKIGSALLVNSETGEIRFNWLEKMADDIANLRSREKEVIIVSSGAVALAPALKALKSDAIVTKSKPFSIILVAYSVVPL